MMFQEEKISQHDPLSQSPNPQNLNQLSLQNTKFLTKVGSFVFSSQNIIGKGNFSKVYKACHQLNQKHRVAIKVIQKNCLKQDLKILVDSQLKILKSVNHPNIIKCLQIKQDEKNIYVIMELCEEGDLQSRIDRIGPMSEDQAAPIIKGVLKGLLYLSECNIIHRDIKAANIFIRNGVPKIADFGFAILSNSKKQFQDISIGSPIYMSPEGIKHNVYGPTTDVWSFGVFVYELLHGKTPYWHCTRQKQLKYNISNQIRWSNFKSNLSYSMKEVIFKCLQVNYQKRITFQKLQDTHFFNEHSKHIQLKVDNSNQLNERYKMSDKGQTQREDWRCQKSVRQRKIKQRCNTQISDNQKHSFLTFSDPFQSPIKKQIHHHPNRPNSHILTNQPNQQLPSFNIHQPYRSILHNYNNHQSIKNKFAHSPRNININHFPNSKVVKIQTFLHFPSQNTNCYLYLIQFSRLMYKLICHIRNKSNLDYITSGIQQFCHSLLLQAQTKIQDYLSNIHSNKNSLHELNKISQTINTYIGQYESLLDHHSDNKLRSQSLIQMNFKLQKEMNSILSNQIKTHKCSSQIAKLLYLGWIYSYHFNCVYLNYFLHLQSQHWYRYALGLIIEQIQTDIDLSNSVSNLQTYLTIKRKKCFKQ